MRAWRRLRTRGSEVTTVTPGGGRRTGPSLSASDVVIFLVPTVGLITSAATAGVSGDSTTGVSGNLVPNASWPEVFFPLSDIVGGTLLMKRLPE
jgi:hypothetical protein